MAVEINGAQELGVRQLSYGRTCVRASGGGLYVVGVDESVWGVTGMAVVVWYSVDGVLWAEKDNGNRPVEESGAGGDLRGVAMAIDSNDLLHIIFKQLDHDEWSYTTFDTTTDQWNGGAAAVIEEIDGGDETPNAYQQLSIAIDSNDVPHVVYSDETTHHGTDYDTIYYNNRIGGAWNANSEEIEGATTTQKSCAHPEIDINDNDRPVIVYLNDTDDDITAVRGQANDPGGWDTVDVDQTVLTGNTNCPSIATDSDGNVWIAYVDGDNTIDIAKQSANWTDPWGIQSDGDAGESPSLAINGTDIYVFYEDDNDNICYNRYVGAAWLGETTIENPFPGLEHVHARYANLNLAAYATWGIDYVWADANNDYWWNRLVIAVAVRRIFITHV